MKKLTALPLVLFGLSSFAQMTNGIDPDHMLLPDTNRGEDRKTYIPKRMALNTGVELEYVEQGPPGGIPVIFLHGLTDSWHSFETVLPNLPNNIRAFALSQRGHGDSDKPSDVYSPEFFADDVAAFIAEKGLGKAVIVGHSFGGVIAQRFALDYPDLTARLVIVSSDAAIGKNPGMPEFFNEVMQIKGKPSREFMEQFQMATLSRKIDSAYFNLLVDESLKVPGSVFQQAFKGMMDANYIDQLKRISQPTLILWADKDSMVFREGQETLLKNISGSKWIVYESTGHALHWEYPERFAKDLVDFISGNE